MNTFYTDERNTLILLGLLKEHNIRKVIASPGTTNICLVASMQQDNFFEMYSAADERSAAYIACGMAEESGEPVILTCTGATASRNYMPGLTEAFYRKLPILAITSTQHIGKVGQNIAQVIDRSIQIKDTLKLSIHLPTCHTKEDEWVCAVQVNRAILDLKRNGGGPVHLNLETAYSPRFSTTKLPTVQSIQSYCYQDHFPEVRTGKIGVFVGAHSKWNEQLVNLVDCFCAKYDAVVLCDQTSNYRGKYRVLFNLVTSQTFYHSPCNNFDLLIHIGNISGAYPNFNSREEWRVNPDGEIRDTFQHLSSIFAMEEEYFFKKLIEDKEVQMTTNGQDNSFAKQWHKEYQMIYNQLPPLPFSNIWIAMQTASNIPPNCIVHLGILNTLRSWNFFETPEDVRIYCNTGGFGIDGILSTAIGAAIANPNSNVFCIIGDLAFFYDMNSLGNHHVPRNLRIMLINNGCGAEFRNYNHPGAQFGDDVDAYIAAANHYGSKSQKLIKHYAEDLGYDYFAAIDKNSWLNGIKLYLVNDIKDRPCVFEVFTDWQDESKALELIKKVIIPESENRKEGLKSAVKTIVGEKGFQVLKKIVKKD